MTVLHPWRTGRVSSGGEEIAYEVVGADGPTVVLTHGAGGSHASWFQQVPFLAALGYRVVTWDTRGFGTSTFRTGVFGCDASVADMVAVLDATGTTRAHLVGQSMGGWWVTAFTLAHPDRVKSLTLSNTIGGLWTDALVESFGTNAVTTPTDEPRLGVHPALGAGLVATDPARAFLYQELNTFHTPPMGAVVKALTGTRVEPAALDTTGVRIQVITGSDDMLFPAALVAESVARLARVVVVVEIPDAGHSPYFECPDEYNEALAVFLAG